VQLDIIMNCHPLEITNKDFMHNSHENDTLHTIDVDGTERSYLVHIPPGGDAIGPLPVVLAFHGGRSNAEGMVRFCGLNPVADEAGFVVVYPNGTGPQPHLLSWDAGICCNDHPPDHPPADEIGFVSAMLDDLSARLPVDLSRVYATGMSNGGMLSYRLAAELSERIAAIASIGGTMGTECCTPSRPVPILHMHGTEDYFVPLEGGRGKRSPSRTEFFSVAHTLDCWKAANRCDTAPLRTEFPALVDDGTSVWREVFPPGDAGAVIELYIIEGGGHTWPGQKPPLLFLGKSTKNLDANAVLWKFFEQHRLPGV